jgi:hypothetical protein
VLEDIDVDEGRTVIYFDFGRRTALAWGWVEVMGCRYCRLGKCTVLGDICADVFCVRGRMLVMSIEGTA